MTHRIAATLLMLALAAPAAGQWGTTALSSGTMSAHSERDVMGMVGLLDIALWCRQGGVFVTIGSWSSAVADFRSGRVGVRFERQARQQHFEFHVADPILPSFSTRRNRLTASSTRGAEDYVPNLLDLIDGLRRHRTVYLIADTAEGPVGERLTLDGADAAIARALRGCNP